MTSELYILIGCFLFVGEFLLCIYLNKRDIYGIEGILIILLITLVINLVWFFTLPLVILVVIAKKIANV